jgi:hypothetical protein
MKKQDRIEKIFKEVWERNEDTFEQKIFKTYYKLQRDSFLLESWIIKKVFIEQKTNKEAIIELYFNTASAFFRKKAIFKELVKKYL